MSVELNNESGVDLDFLDSLNLLARFVLGQLRIHEKAELNVLLVDDATISELNQRWLGHEGPTDVLSFPLDELTEGDDGPEHSGALLGDVIICPQVAIDQARDADHSVLFEMQTLLVHGILHILGYDHAEPLEEQRMFALQDELLLRYGA